MCLFAPLCTGVQAGTVRASRVTSWLRSCRLRSGLRDHFPFTGGLQDFIAANDAVRCRLLPFFVASANDAKAYGPGRAVSSLIKLREVGRGMQQGKVALYLLR